LWFEANRRVSNVLLIVVGLIVIVMIKEQQKGCTTMEVKVGQSNPVKLSIKAEQKRARGDRLNQVVEALILIFNAVINHV
jgi:hypothetical protein